jgi:hypothetical protein
MAVKPYQQPSLNIYMSSYRMHDDIKVIFEGAGTKKEVVSATYKKEVKDGHRVRLDEDADDVAGAYKSRLHKVVDKSQIR